MSASSRYSGYSSPNRLRDHRSRDGGSMSVEFSSLRQEIDDLNDQLREERDEKLGLKSEMRSFKRDLRKARESIKLQNSEVSHLKEQLVNSRSSSSSSSSNAKRIKRRQTARSIDDLDSPDSLTPVEEKLGLIADVSSLNAEIDSMKRMLKEEQARSKLYRSRTEELEDEISSLSKSLSKSSTQVMMLKKNDELASLSSSRGSKNLAAAQEREADWRKRVEKRDKEVKMLKRKLAIEMNGRGGGRQTDSNVDDATSLLDASENNISNILDDEKVNHDDDDDDDSILRKQVEFLTTEKNEMESDLAEKSAKVLELTSSLATLSNEFDVLKESQKRDGDDRNSSQEKESQRAMEDASVIASLEKQLLEKESKATEKISGLEKVNKKLKKNNSVLKKSLKKTRTENSKKTLELTEISSSLEETKRDIETSKESLRKEVAKCQRENELLASELSNSEVETSSAKKALRKLTREMSELESSFAQQSSLSDDLSRNNERLERSNRMLESQVKSLEFALSNADSSSLSSLKELNAKIVSLNDSNTVFRDSILEMEKANSMLREREKESAVSKASLSKEVSSLRSLLEKSESECGEVNTRLKRICTDVETLRQHAKEDREAWDRERENLTSKISSLESKCEEKEFLASSLSSEISASSSSLNEALSTLKEELMAAQLLIKTKQNTIEEMSEKNGSLAKDSEHWEREFKNSSELAEKQSLEITTLKSQLIELKFSGQDINAKLKSEMSSLNFERNALEARIGEMTRSAKEEERKWERNRSELIEKWKSELEKNDSKWLGREGELREGLSSRDSEISSLNSTIRSMTSSNNSLEEKIASLEESIASKIRSLASASALNDSLMSQANASHHSWEDERSSLLLVHRNSVRQMELDHSSVVSSLREQMKCLSEAKDQLELMKKEGEDSLLEQCESLENSLALSENAYESQLAALRAEKEASSARLTREMEKMSERLKSAESSLETEKRTSSARMSSFEETIASLNDNLRISQNRSSDLRNSLSQVNSLNDELKETIEDLKENFGNERKESEREIEFYQRRVEELTKDLDSTVDSLNSERKRVEEMKVEAGTTSSSPSSTSGVSNSKLDEMESNSRDLERRIRSWEKRFSRMTSEFEVDRQHWALERDSLEAERQVDKRSISVIRDECESCKVSLRNADAEIEVLEREKEKILEMKGQGQGQGQETLKREIFTLQSRLNATSDELNELKEKRLSENRRSKDEIASLQSTLAKTKSSLSSSDSRHLNEIATLRESMRDLSASRDYVEKELTASRKELFTRIESLSSSHEKEIRTLSDSFAKERTKLSQSLQTLSNSIEEAKRSHAEAEEEWEEERKKLMRVTKELHVSVRERTSTIEELKGSVDRLSNEVNSLSMEKKNLSASLIRSSSSLESSSRRLETKEKEIDACNEEIERLRESGAKLEILVRQSNEEIEFLSAQNSKLQSFEVKSENISEELRREIEDLQERNSSLESEIERLEEELDSSNGQSRSQVLELEEINASLREEKISSKTMIEKLSARISERALQTSERMAEMTKEHMEEMKRVESVSKESLASLREENENEVKELRSDHLKEMASMERRVAELNSTVRSVEKEKADLSKTEEEARGRVCALEEELEACKSSSPSSPPSSSTTALDELISENQSLNTKISSLEKSLTRNYALLESLKESSAIEGEEKNSAKEELNRVKDELFASERAAAEGNRSLQRASREIARLTSALSSLEESKVKAKENERSLREKMLMQERERAEEERADNERKPSPPLPPPTTSPSPTPTPLPLGEKMQISSLNLLSSSSTRLTSLTASRPVARGRRRGKLSAVAASQKAREIGLEEEEEEEEGAKEKEKAARIASLGGGNASIAAAVKGVDLRAALRPRAKAKPQVRRTSTPTPTSARLPDAFKSITTLWRVKGVRKFRMHRVPLSPTSLTSTDAFILLTPSSVCRWKMKASGSVGRMKEARAVDICERIKSQRGAKVAVMSLTGGTPNRIWRSEVYGQGAGAGGARISADEWESGEDFVRVGEDDAKWEKEYSASLQLVEILPNDEEGGEEGVSWKLSEPNPPSQSLLFEDSVHLLIAPPSPVLDAPVESACAELYLWTGRRSPLNQRSWGMEAMESVIRNEGWKEANVLKNREPQGGESVGFTEKFAMFAPAFMYSKKPTSGTPSGRLKPLEIAATKSSSFRFTPTKVELQKQHNVRKLKDADISEIGDGDDSLRTIDLSILLSSIPGDYSPPPPGCLPPEDLATGSDALSAVEVYVIKGNRESSTMEAIPPNERGIFYASSVYVVYWRYWRSRGEMSNPACEYKLFTWHGSRSTKTEGGVASMKVIDLDGSKGKESVSITRVDAGCESSEFLRIFGEVEPRGGGGGGMIVLSGKNGVAKPISEAGHSLFATTWEIGGRKEKEGVPSPSELVTNQLSNESLGSVLSLLPSPIAILTSIDSNGREIRGWVGEAVPSEIEKRWKSTVVKRLASLSECVERNEFSPVNDLRVYRGQSQWGDFVSSLPSSSSFAPQGSSALSYPPLNLSSSSDSLPPIRFFTFTDRGAMRVDEWNLLSLGLPGSSTEDRFPVKGAVFIAAPSCSADYVWCGKDIGDRLQRSVLEASLRWAKNDDSRTRASRELLYVPQGFEPIEMKSLFLAGTGSIWELNSSLMASAPDDQKILHNSDCSAVSTIVRRFTRTIPLSTLQARPLPDRVDPKKLEKYLSVEEFESVFGMSKESFKQIPLWKQLSLKKKIGLY